MILVLRSSDLPVDTGLFERLCREAASAEGDSTAFRVCDAANEFAANVVEASASGASVLCLPGQLGEADAVQTAAAEAADAPLVWLDLRVATTPRRSHLDPLSIPSIRGRGLEGLPWAVRSLAARRRSPVSARFRYGDSPETIGELRIPAGVKPYAVCVLIHGGGWRERWERDLMDPLAADLTERGFATWNIEFRRVGPSGGGWPRTFEDVGAAIDHLKELSARYPLDLKRVVLVGHSAGAHLAMWAANRQTQPLSAPGSPPTVNPALVVSLAGVPDLTETAERGTDEMSTIALLGGLPDEVPDRYALASPAARLPHSTPELLVWGTRDRPDLIDNNLVYHAVSSKTASVVETLELDGEDHFTVVDPRSGGWARTLERLIKFVPPRIEVADIPHAGP